MFRALVASLFVFTGCGVSTRGNTDGGGFGQHDLAGQRTYDLAGGNPQPGCGQELADCYTVYAHADHVLYHIDLPNKMLVVVGPFNAPMVNGSEDVITDLAVAPDNTIYAVSHTTLYTADPNDGHVTTVGSLSDCGTQTVALTFMPDGNLYAGDYQGAFCHVDITSNPPKVTQIGTLGGNLALAGDIVAVADGTMYGTAYDKTNSSTQQDNYLVKMDPSTGTATIVGKTNFPKMFGVAYAEGQVFGFTHDGSGNVATIDPKTGVGTMYNSFKDPSTGKLISFAGAGVNSMVAPSIM